MNIKLLKQNCKHFYRKLLILVVIASISCSATIAIPYYIGVITDILNSNLADGIVQTGSEVISAIMEKLVIMLILVVVSFIFSFLLQKYSQEIALEIAKNLREKAFEKLSYARLSDIGFSNVGNLQTILVGDIEKIFDGLSTIISLTFTSVITIIAMLVMVLVINVFALILIFLMLPLALLVSKFIATKSQKYFREEADDTGILGGISEEFLSNQKTAKLLSLENVKIEEFEKQNANLYDSGKNSQFFSSLVNPSTRLVNNFVYISLGFLGGILCLNYGLSIGAVVSFLGYATSFAQPINNFTSASTQLGMLRSSLARVRTVMSFEAETSGKIQLTDIQKIEFCNTCFGYTKQKQILNNFNFIAEKGQNIAIVGKTGSGKSTVISLLLRFYDVDKGNIYINDIDIREYDLNSLRTQFSMVLQETWLFRGTIRENLLFSKADATDAEVEKVLQLTSLEHHLKKFPHGIDTMIEENDSFSLGQRQLITVARAMLSPSENLILDEATSNVDLETERQIAKNFSEMMQGKTTFIIAHRPATIENCDKKIVIK